LLPVFYALLGSSAYDLRLYSYLIRRREFLPSVAHNARHFIAAIAGLIIGMAGSLLPEKLAMPPLAAAFLVGYATDAFTSRLDNLISRFRASNSATQPRAPTGPEGSGALSAAPVDVVMDPIRAVVTALALGATAAIKKNVPNQAVEDVFRSLTALIKSRYPYVVTDQLEQLDSKTGRDVLRNILQNAGARRWTPSAGQESG